MRTAARQINMAARPEEIPRLTARQTRARASIDRAAGLRPARWIAARAQAVETAAAAAPAQAAWTGAAAVREETASGIEVSLHLPAAETAVRLAAPRVVRAGVLLDPAAAGALPALAEAEVPAAAAVLAAAAVDGGE